MSKYQKNTDGQNVRERRNIAGLVINIILIVAIIIAFFCTYTAYMTKNGSGVPDIFGYEPFSIQSDSMSPFFEKGDLVIDKRVEDTSEIQVGDVITFWTIINGEKVLNTHRVVEVQDGENFRYFVTKGDNNTIEDSLTVHESEVVGIYHKHIKKLGSVLDFLQTSKGFFCIIIIPVLAFFIYYLVSFFRVLMEYQGEKRKLLFEQELVSQGRLRPEDVSPQAQAALSEGGQAPQDEKQMKEVFNRFLEKHQGKSSPASDEMSQADRQKLEEQLKQLQRQMEQMQAKTEEMSQQTPVQETQDTASASAQTQKTNTDGITLTAEQLMALLAQVNMQPQQPAQPEQPVQPVQPVQQTESVQPEQTGSGEKDDTISVSKSEFVDLLSLAMKKAKEEAIEEAKEKE